MYGADRESFKTVLTEAKKHHNGNGIRQDDDEIVFDPNTGRFSIESPNSDRGWLVTEMKNAVYYFGDDLGDCDIDKKVDDYFLKKDGKKSHIERSLERIEEIEG